MRRWLVVRLRRVTDIESLRVAEEELMTFLASGNFDDARTTFLARLTFNDWAISKIKQRTEK